MTDTTNHLGQAIGFPVPDWKPATCPTGEVMNGRYCRLEPLDTKRHAADLFAALSRDAEGWRPYNGGGMHDPGNVTGGHYDHLHVTVG